jgi:hypothetical protein
LLLAQNETEMDVICSGNDYTTKWPSPSQRAPS